MKTYDDWINLKTELQYLGKIFDKVRLVDPVQKQLINLEMPDITRQGDKYCKKEETASCMQCTSVLPLLKQNRQGKIERIGADWYFVLSFYGKIHNKSYELEMFSRVTDEKSAVALQYREKDFEKLRRLVELDELTGVYNRRYYNRSLVEMQKWAEYSGEDFMLAMIDIDYLKRTNDRYGHSAGDALLKTLAKVMEKNIHKEGQDFLARIGGDEFAIVMSKIHPEILKQQLKVMCDQVRKTKIEGFPNLLPSISVGAAFYRETNSLAALQGKADDRLYQAKKQGKGTIKI